ncbi:hypothetical protein C8J56DRAFT_1059282 [Mycena floridula]|nr:hypothetical protein C8J56DRAFT_1059282 [Mycena floridula]
MPPLRAASVSSDDDDAPESVPLNQAKKAEQQASQEWRKFDAERKEKKRAQNREKDRRLKEQASKRKGKQVQREEDVSDENKSDSDSDAVMDDDTDSDASDHLPDHLFESAFASSKTKKSKSLPEIAKRKTRSRNRPKDLIIGSRTIRTLSDIDRASLSAPSSKAKKFLERSLALRGGNSRSKGWERRAVNVGILKGTGPAAHFVRKV